MSASDTDIERQINRRRVTFVGIACAVIAVVAIVLGVTAFGADPLADAASSGELKGEEARLVTN